MNTVLLLIFTLFSLISFVAILVGTDPYSANVFIRVLFFTTLFFLFVGVLSVAGIFISKLTGARSGTGVLFRRGAILGALIMSLILLETFSALNVISASAVFLLAVSFELLAVYKK